MDDARPRPAEDTTGLIAFALATCNVSLLLLVVLLLGYRGGGLGEALEDVGTPLGLALFALLWGSTLWATNRALRGLGSLDQVSIPTACNRAVLWGGWNGVVVFLGLLGGALVAISIGAVVDQEPGDSGVQLAEVPVALGALAAYAAIGSLVAFVLGAGIGTLAAIIDVTLLSLARWILRGG
jgi:hypothetical protein